MYRRYISLGVVILISFLAGCTDGPTSPVSSIPVILLDHVEEEDVTKVYVHGIEDTLYENITIQINNETSMENYTYSLHTVTTLEKFMLNITVWFKLKEYEYRGNYTLVKGDDEITLEIEDQRHDNPIERSFPYTIIMERKK